MEKLIDHKEYIETYGDDMPEINNWQWGQHVNSSAKGGSRTSTEGDNI
jgi:xylulose-5-phosphate/fructose-6-phosphate phosphoketolase